MAHQVEVTEERYIYQDKTKKLVLYILIAGVLLFGLGLWMAIANEGHQADGHGGHGSLNNSELVASTQQDAHHSEEAHEAHGHHESPVWLKRLKTSLWMNNTYFIGFGIIGLFFVAIQYAAMAGWSAGVKRIALAFGSWIPWVGLLTIVLFFVVKSDVFHWTHHDLYGKELENGSANPDYDAIIDGKAPFFFFPLAGGTFPLFFILRMVLFFGLWFVFYRAIYRNMVDEDLNGTTAYWYKNRGTATWFLLFFAVSSSVCAWDWVMSIDTHWFSTMFGWYVFASWWVTGLAAITLVAAHLKSAGYLKVVNSNHLHDLGKFVFAFSIFWTYIWFGQYLLIWYANIPEETVYFIERLETSPYSWIFYLNLILNFVLPFLLLMTRDAKRQISTLKLVCPIIIVGHWFDFYNMVTPGVMHQNGAVGFLEIGLALIYAAVLLMVVLGSLGKLPLYGKNDPMLEESLHHHI
jgi:hypothetical protein